MREREHLSLPARLDKNAYNDQLRITSFVIAVS